VQSSNALAIDVGGTKIAGAVIDSDGQILRRDVVPTGDGGPDDVWAPVEQMIESLLDADVAAVGVGSAGPIDLVAGTVSPINITAWRDFPIRDRVQATTKRPVSLAGDGQCAAVAEVAIGAAAGACNGLLIVVSTGIGGARFFGGRVQVGPSGNAGHIGHVVIERNGRRCPCGQRGCVEAYASGPSMVRIAMERGWLPEPEAGVETGSVQAVSLFASARAGDPTARRCISDAADVIALAILNEAAMLEHDRVIIGGGVSGASDLLIPAIEAALARNRHLIFLREPRVVLAALGPDASLVGAGLLAQRPDSVS